MRIDKLGTIVSLFIALGAAACSEDEKPAPNPTPDSGSPMDSGGNPEDADADALPPGDMRPCTGSTIAEGTAMLTHAGVTYNYLVHLPTGYDGSKRTPLVVNWHGSGSTGFEQQIYSGGNGLADEGGFIVVHPSSPDKTWNTGTCCTNLIDGGNTSRDDVGFARALVDEIAGKACVDEKRIYSMGMSNGGFMSHRLACEAADRFAAVESVAGDMPITPCQPSRPISVIQFHGTADATIPYDMPRFSAENVAIPEMMKNWAMRNGCTKGPDTTFQMGVVTCQTWSQCGRGTLVTFCTEEGVGHCWPGAAFCPGDLTTTSDISASRDGWAFLKQFVLP